MTNPDEHAVPNPQEIDRDLPPVIDHDPAPPAPDPVVPADSGAPPPERPRAPVVVRGGGSNILTLVLFGILGGALYFVWSNPQVPSNDAAITALRRQVQAQADQRADDQGAAQALGQQVQGLADRVDRLQKAAASAAAPPAAAPADLGDLPKRVDDLAAKVAALADRPADTGAASAPPADSGAAQQAVEALGRQVAQSADSQKAALTDQKAALEQLAARLDKLEQGAGQSVGATDRVVRLTRVQAALVALQAGEKLGDIPGAPPAVARFANVAPPTEAALREAFPALAAHARKVSRPDVSRRGFFERALTRLQQSVTVRQGDDVLIGDPAAGILAEAGGKLQAGDLAGAVASLGKLSGPAADAMKDWVDRARALLAARAALTDLAAHS
jgi:hypothetical protein